MTASRFIIISFFLSLIMLGESCRSKKIVTGGKTSLHADSLLLNNEAARIIVRSRQNNLAYEQFASRIKVEYSDGDLSQDLTASVRMLRDSLLWISLQGPFGIEGARILMTRDSIFILDKMHNAYLHQPLSYMNKVMPMRTDIHNMQSFILGAFMLFNDVVPEYRGMEDSLYNIQSEAPKFRYKTALYPQNYTLAKSLLTDLLLGHEMRITFGGYTPEQGQPFSHERAIDIKQGNRHISVHLEFTKIKINEALSFPYDVGPGMQEVSDISFR